MATKEIDLNNEPNSSLKEWLLGQVQAGHLVNPVTYDDGVTEPPIDPPTELPETWPFSPGYEWFVKKNTDYSTAWQGYVYTPENWNGVVVVGNHGKTENGKLKSLYANFELLKNIIDEGQRPNCIVICPQWDLNIYAYVLWHASVLTGTYDLIFTGHSQGAGKCFELCENMIPEEIRVCGFVGVDPRRYSEIYGNVKTSTIVKVYNGPDDSAFENELNQYLPHAEFNIVDGQSHGTIDNWFYDSDQFKGGIW